MFRGVSLVNLVLEVEAGRCGAQAQRGDVFFHAALQRFDALRGASRAENEHTGGQRVERAGVSHFYFLAAHSLRNQPAHFRHELKRRHVERLVEGQYLSG